MKIKRKILAAVILCVCVAAAIVTVCLKTKKKKMVYVMDKIYENTGQDVTAEVEKDIAESEIDSPYAGKIEDSVSSFRIPSKEYQSNFGHVGTDLVFYRSDIAVLMGDHWIWFQKNRKSSDKLFADASPETSALSLWVYDGNKVERGWIYEKQQEEKIISYFNGLSLLNADDVVVEDLQGPMYGFEIGTKDGTMLTAVWRDGYWFDNQRHCYEVKPDFDSIVDQYDWTDQDSMPLTTFPNLYKIAIDGKDQWIVDLLTKSPELTKDALQIEISNYEDDVITAVLSNKTEQDIDFGEYYSIQVQLDGVWYDIPAKYDLCVNDIGIILQKKKEMTKTYDLAPYGLLPSGTYRIVVENASAEFTVE